MNNTEVKKLYKALLSKGYSTDDLGDETTFNTKMSDPNNRKELYDWVSSNGNFRIGDYDSYERRLSLGFMQPDKTISFEQNNSVAPTPSEKPEEEKVQLSFTAPKRPELKSLQVEQKEYPTIAETAQKMMADNVSQRHQLSDMTSRVQSALDRRGAELDEIARQNPNSFVARGTAGSIAGFDAGRMYDSEYRNYAAAKESLQKAQDIIDAVGKESEDKEKGHTGFGGFLKGSARGAEDAFYDWNTWSMGLKDTSEGLALLKALDAAEGGTLTESQQALLDAKALEIATEQAYSSSLGRGYKAGKMTVESLPFMVEFAFNPIAGAGKTAANRMARYALNRFGKEAVKKNAGKYIAGKAISQVAADALKAGAIAATSGAGRTAADALQRMQGDIYYQPNEEGKVEFWKREGGEDATTAFAKAYAGTTIENFSEMLGNYFAPIGKVAGIGVSKGLGKVGLGSVNQMLQDVKANDLAQLVADFEKRAQWNGTIGEFGEEIAGGILNSIIVGDQTLDTDENTGLFNKDNLIDTYLGVALLGGGLSAAKTVDYPIYKYESRKNINNARLDFEDAFGKDDETAKISEALTSDDPRIAGETLRNIIGNEDYTPKQQMTAAIYAKTVQAYKGANLYLTKWREDVDTPAEQVEIADSYDNGRSLETPQEKNEAKMALDFATEEMHRVFGLDADADVDAYIGEDAFAIAQQMRDQNLEDGQVVLNYLNAKAKMDGLYDQINDDIDLQIDQSNRIIDSRINKDDNLIHPATMRLNDRKVYIVSGNVAKLDDGTIDTANSTESIIVMDAQTGKTEFTTAKDIRVADEPIDPTVEKNAAAEMITNAISDQAEREIDGVLPFNADDVYTFLDEQGATHNIVVVGDNGDGTINAVVDGNEKPQVMAKTDVQSLVDNTKKAQYNANIEAQKGESKVVESSPNEVVAEPTANVEQVPESVVPMLKNGQPDFNAMDAEMFVNEYASRYGEDNTAKLARKNISSARDEIAKIDKKIDDITDPNQMQGLFDKKAEAEARLNRYIDILDRMGMSEDVNETEANQKSKLRNESGNKILTLFPDGLPNVESFILADIATGNRVRWSDKVTNGAVTSRGLGAELGLSDSNKERVKRLALISNDAMTPEEYAESLRERLDAAGIRYDETALRDDVINTYASVDTRKGAWEALENIANRAIEQEQEIRDWEDAQQRIAYEMAKDAVELPPVPDLATMEEEVPVELGASFDENINEIENILNDERSTENTDVPASVSAEDGIADGDQTSIEMVQGAGTDNTLGDRGSIGAGQGSNESNVGEGVADVPSSEVSGGAEVDNQGNPINPDGSLKLEKVESIDDMTDEDFENPYRNIELPTLPENVADAIGSKGKSVVIKKNIFERNIIRHSDLTPDQSRDILKSALYSPNLYGQNQKKRKPYNWVVVSTKDANGQNKLVLLEISDRKNNIEIVHWHYVDARGLEKLKRQAEREDGQLLILPSEFSEEVGALSDPTLSMPSENKDTTSEPQKQEVEQKNVVSEQEADISDEDTTSMRVSPLTKREEMRRKPLRARAKMWEAKVGVPVHLIETFEEVPTEDARKAILDGKTVTAWVTDGEVYLYMPYLRNRTEVDKTYIHEVVAHVGMKRLLGKEGYRQFCMRVYNEVMTEADREFYDAYPNVKNHAQAADEYIAHLSEDTDMESSIWQKVVRIFRDALRVLGIETALTNKDIQDMLRDSYRNLTNEENVSISESEGTQLRSVYHGSGSDFSKFDHSFMGTGEGHQAFGWGTYVTDVEGIGKQYAKMTSKPRLIFKGEFVDSEEFNNPWRIIKDLYNSNHGKLRGMRNDAERIANMVEPDNAEMKELWGNVVRTLSEVRSGDLKITPARYLYSVEIPDDNGKNYIHWDKNVPSRIFEKLTNILPIKDVSYWLPDHIKDSSLANKLTYWMREGYPKEWKSWGAFYKALSNVLGSDKAASEFLNENGYVGISYPADGGNAGKARNYVIFNESDLEIKDSTRFRVADKEVANVIVNTTEIKLPTNRGEAIDAVSKMRKPFINLDQDKEIKVSNKAIRHAATQDNSHEYVDVRCIGVIDRIIENAVKIGEIPPAEDEKGKTHLVEVYYCPVNVDGKQYSVRMLVKQYENRGRVLDDFQLYDLAAKQKKSDASSQGTGKDSLTPLLTPDSFFKVKDLIHNSQEIDKEILGIDGETRFRIVEPAPTFYSNAERATENVKQEKATPEQWLKMIEKNGGLKAGEDKWLGLSDWLKSSDKKTLTKQEVLDFIKENQIKIEEVEYGQVEWVGENEIYESEEFTNLLNSLTEYEEDNGEEYPYIDKAKFQELRNSDEVFVDGFDIDYWGESIEIKDPRAAARYLGLTNGGVKNINGTRIQYTTDGLDNKREIALTVPTIESWNESDEIHFGDAGNGRAIAWVRFGETTDADGNRVLVIDEVQSKRHQAGRDEGYKDEAAYRKAKKELDSKSQELFERRNALIKVLEEKYGSSLYNYLKSVEIAPWLTRLVPNEEVMTREEVREYNETSQDAILQQEADLKEKYLYGIPSAPFEKNWAELAMKRMLRYAAENGFDKIAWTTGDQQAERYDIGNTVDGIDVVPYEAQSASEIDGFDITIRTSNYGERIELFTDRKGEIQSGEIGGSSVAGKHLSDILGKPLANKIISNEGGVITDVDKSDSAKRADYANAVMQMMAKYNVSRPVDLQRVISDTDKATLDALDPSYVVSARTYSGDGLRIGGEGMKAFYDQMIPSFMNKYGKKWGVKVGEVTMPSLEENNTMHSIDVTDAMRESVMQGQPMFRITGYDNQFADLQSEYDALDKNDAKALNEWREKKVDVVESYLYGVADNFGMRPEIIVFNGADEEQTQEVYDLFAETFRRNGVTPPTYEAFIKKALDEDVFATYYRGGDVIINNIAPKDSQNKKMQYAANLFHEDAHHHAYILYNAKELKEIWDDVKGSNLPLVEKLNTARLYKDKSDASKGNEFIAHSIGALVREHQALFQQFLRGENGVTADDVVKKLKYKKVKANFAVAEILNRIKDEYQESRNGESISGGIGGGRPNRVPRRVLQVNVPRQNGGRGTQEQRGRFVLEPLANDVAQRGLREMVGEDAYNAFLMRALRDTEEATRRSIIDTAIKNGLNFHEAIEDYLASLAELENADSAYMGRVKRLFADMLEGAGIEVNGINDNEVRYLLWRNNLQDGGVLGLAEDVVMQRKLGVGRFSTQEADTSFRVTEREQIIADAKANGTYLKAPNGKDTNLTPDQWVTVRTDAFKKWFGDWENDPADASKVVDANGEPMVVYHYSDIPNITIFNPFRHKEDISDAENIKLKAIRDAYKDNGRSLTRPFMGIWATPIRGEYAEYGQYEYELFANIRKPKITNRVSPSLTGTKGADGVFSYSNDVLMEVSTTLPERFKSATGNVGTFDSNNDDIRFRVAPSTRASNEAQGVRESFDQMVKSKAYQMKEAGYDRLQSIKEYLRLASKAHGVELEDNDVKNIASYENPYIAMINKSSINEKEIEAWERKFYIPILDATKKIRDASKDKIDSLKGIFGAESIDDIFNNYLQGKHGLERNRDMAVKASLDKMEKATLITKQEAEQMLEQVNEELKNDIITPTQADARRQQIGNMLGTKKHTKEQVKYQTEVWEQRKKAIKEDKTLDTWRKKQEALDKVATTEFGVDLAERDYSGLGEVFRDEDSKLEQSIASAYDAVEAFENAFDTKELWDAINAATESTLEIALQSSVISRDTFDKIRSMYDYYIPLRGFEADTTEDVYGYLNNETKAFSMPVKRANGRASKAEFAIPHILQMAHSAILQGNNNRAKLAFANFAQHYTTDLVKQSNMWIEYNEADKQWEAAFPTDRIKKDATAEQVSEIVDEWNAEMEQLAKENPDKYRKVKGKMDVPYIVPKDKMDAHQIRYKRNGVDYILTVNGSPRLAYAMNGAIDQMSNKLAGDVGEAVEGFTRYLSGMYTQYNPDFMVSNFFRDASFVLSTVWVRENPKYAAKFYKNYAISNPAVMTRLFAKYENGTLDRNKPLEAAFEDFLKNGGETGYAILKDVEQTKKRVAKDINQNLWGKVMALVDRLGVVGRGVESSARFAAYLTSREAGRSISRSVYDAKEVSVNFNRKGAGAAFNDLADQTKIGKIVGSTAGIFKITHAFFNAGVQGLAGISKLVKYRPAKSLTMLTSSFFLGMIIASLFDDDDEYYNLTETVRRQNIIIPMGNDYFSIPLAIELRAMYGLGEMMVSLTRGKEDLTDKNVAYKIAEQILQAFPINVLEGNGGFDALLPTAVSIVTEVMLNEDWQGMPIYREDKYTGDEYIPEWEMVSGYTDNRLVAASKFLSEATGGDYGERGTIEINPAVVQHIMEGLFGGPMSFFNKVTATYDTAFGDKEFEWRNVPFLNRVVKDGGGKAQERTLNNEYRNNKEKYEALHKQELRYNEFIRDESHSEEERAEYKQKLDELRNSEEYKRMNAFNEDSKDIDKMYKQFNEKGTLDENMSLILEEKEKANAPLRDLK